MINRNGGLFWGTLIDTHNLSSILTDIDGNTITGNVTCSRGTGSGNAIPNFNNKRDYATIRTYARIGYGNTTPNVNEYALENEENNGTNINDIVICCGATRDIGTGTGTRTQDLSCEVDGTVCYSFDFYNNTDEDITFYEIGMFVNTATSTPTHPFMITRNVNKDGWLIKAREVITLTIEIDYAGNEIITKQGARFFSNLFLQSSGMYGFKQPSGAAPKGSVQATPTGSNSNTQAITDNGAGGTTPVGVFMRVGVGTTEMDYSDYKLENEVVNEDNINDIISVSSAVLNNNSTSNGVWEYEYTLNNTSSDSIRFYEIGLFVRASFGVIMLARKVNSEGWEIAGNGSKNITISIGLYGATNSDETVPPND